jgi:hypothetical protein
MMTLEEIAEALQNKNLSKVSRDLNMCHRQQVWRIKSGKDKNPTYKIVKKLSDYLEANQ